MKQDKLYDYEIAHMSKLRKLAAECMVLLKSDGSFPLSKPEKIAVYGNGARHTIKGGTGSGDVNVRHYVTIEEGLENAGFTISTKAWMDAYDACYEKARKEFKAGIKAMIAEQGLSAIMLGIGAVMPEPEYEFPVDGDGEVAIYVLSRISGEGSDRQNVKGDFMMSDTEIRDIRAVSQKYSKFMLVLNVGGVVDISPVIDEVRNVLLLSQTGMTVGDSFAYVLLGKNYPSGKLASTWAEYEEYCHVGDFAEVDDTRYKEGIYVGYRYFDTFGVEPRYPFGYGLSYSEFEMKAEKVAVDGTMVSIDVEVKNIGEKYSGKEVVEVYVSAPTGTLDKEYQSLAGFAKTIDLVPREKDKVRVSFDMCDLASYRESDASFILEAGDYVVRVGNSSRNTTPCAILVIEDEVVVSKHQNICKVQKPFEELKAPKMEAAAELKAVPRIAISKDSFGMIVYPYDTPTTLAYTEAERFVDELSLEDMVEIVVGAGMYNGGNKFDMPGSVGNTTSKFWDKGLVNATLCDGPAGLRIQKRTALIDGKKTKMIDPPLSIFEMMPKIIKKFVMADPDKSTVLYQYTTAFRVSAALAQTWNTKMLYKVGCAVQEEMKEYGCTFWLAPALNIHRNPLCGRNFEYFSEDPFLTGAMAAAITKGIQREEGYYVTIKHFACNNQEDNRKAVSSNVSERALREIYLRGFEKPVREANAKGVMTSYNKVNGVYTPNSYDLCTKVLRQEWGFNGVVMTDWFSTSKGCANNAIAMASGNDLIMPGGKADKKKF